MHRQHRAGCSSGVLGKGELHSDTVAVLRYQDANLSLC